MVVDKKIFCLQPAALSPRFPACPAEFRLASPHKWVSHFLKIDHKYTCVYVYGICILLVLFLWGTLTDPPTKVNVF